MKQEEYETIKKVRFNNSTKLSKKQQCNLKKLEIEYEVELKKQEEMQKSRKEDRDYLLKLTEHLRK